MGRPTGNVSCVKWSEPSDRQRTADCSAAQELKVRALLSDGPNQWGGVTQRLGVLMGGWRARGGGFSCFLEVESCVFSLFVLFFCLLKSAQCNYYISSASASQLPDFLLFHSLRPPSMQRNKRKNNKSLAFETSDSWFFEFKTCRQTLPLLLPGQRKHSCRSEETCR